MARDPWVRTARLLAKSTRRAVASAHRAQDRSLHAESKAQAIQERKDKLSILKDHAYQRGKAHGAREASRLAQVKGEGRQSQGHTVKH